MPILAAVGEGPHAQNVVSVAYDLAETYGKRLVALHVIPTEEFREHKDAIRSTPGYDHFSLDQEESSGAEFAQRIVDESLSEFDQELVEPRGRVGEPAEKILAEADHIDPRFVVIGGTLRSPVGKALFGSTTQTVLIQAAHPVVTIMNE